MKVDVDVAGLARATNAVGDLGDRVADARPVFHRLAERLQEAEAERFADHGGGTWAALDADTIRRKARDRSAKVRGNARRPVVASGRLLASLTGGAGTRGAIREVRPDFLRFGTRNPAANLHQGGAGRMHRPVLMADAATQRVLTDEVRDYLLGKDR